MTDPIARGTWADENDADFQRMHRGEITVDELNARGLQRWMNYDPDSAELRLRIAHDLSRLYARPRQLTLSDRVIIKIAGELLTRNRAVLGQASEGEKKKP